MGEIPTQNPNLPSGFISVETCPESAVVGSETLPWLNESTTLGVVNCELQGGNSFLLANAVGTHSKLIGAADAMTEHQTGIANNMFYSRIQGIVNNGHAPNVEIMASSSTDFNIYVMRNPGGQRVYFAKTEVVGDQGNTLPLVMRLGVCDKNKQAMVMSVLSGSGTTSRKASKGSK